MMTDASASLVQDAGLGDGQVCAEQQVDFSRTIPTVVLLVDQSGSMTTNFSSGTRWDVLRDQLMHPSTGVVARLDQEIRFGLVLYTSHNGGPSCPELTEVRPALENYEAIRAVYDAARPESDTPTGDAIDAVLRWLGPYPEPGPKVIVLATDGEPDTCEKPNPNDPERNPEGRIEALAAASRAYAAGIETYIISVGSEVGEEHLQQMANVGQGLPAAGGENAPFYQANDQAALASALTSIIEGLRSCVFTLKGRVVPEAANQGRVLLDGRSVPQDSVNGWRLLSDTQLELVGKYCETIKSGEHRLEVSFPCGGFVPGPVY